MSPVDSLPLDESRYRILKHLYRYSDFEKRRATPYQNAFYNLNHIRELLVRLGNPQNRFRSLHIAGSKGKGTTTYCLAYLLEEMGYVSGHTVSPQLIDERDRFYFQGRKATWEEILVILEEVLHVAEGMTPTVFDIFTAVAFRYFERMGVEVAVIETGLGGRWDSTNILDPSDLIACLITLIDYDHMDKLGNTLPVIAGEKAGIIKPGIPVFTLNVDPGVTQVLRDRAEELGSPIDIVTTPHPLIEELSSEIDPKYLPTSTWDNLNLAVSCLARLGYPLTKGHVQNVLNRLPVPGRYYKFENLLIDGAHTVHTLKSLIATIKADPVFPVYSRVKVYFYCLYDKDVTGLVGQLPREWELFFFDCNLPYINPAKVEEVKSQIVTSWGREVETVRDLSSLGWKDHPECLYLFTGSFRLVGHILRELEKRGLDSDPLLG